jgi:hypothetical protein
MITVASKRTGGRGEYIGRPSPLGNPFVIGRDGDRDTVVDKYHAWLVGLWNSNSNHPACSELIRLYELHKQQGELTLVCWCAPQRCHGDVVKEVIESFA